MASRFSSRAKVYAGLFLWALLGGFLAGTVALSTDPCDSSYGDCDMYALVLPAYLIFGVMIWLAGIMVSEIVFLVVRLSRPKNWSGD